jgi:hypothetical protein
MFNSTGRRGMRYYNVYTKFVLFLFLIVEFSLRLQSQLRKLMATTKHGVLTGLIEGVGLPRFSGNPMLTFGLTDGAQAASGYSPIDHEVWAHVAVVPHHLS